MLLIFTTFLLVLAGISLAVLLKKVFTPPLLEGDRRRPIDAEHYRPLFAPTDDELLQAEADEKQRLAAKHEQDARLLLEEKLADLENFRQNWRKSPDKAATIELLYRASQGQNGEAYLETASIVLEAWRLGEIRDLLADDLARLLDSHFWLLPAEERTPGVSFRIQQEIADLRRSLNEK